VASCLARADGWRDRAVWPHGHGWSRGRRKISACLAQDLVGLPKLAVLLLEGLQLFGHVGRNAGPLPAIDLGLLDLVMQRLRCAADLGHNRCHCRDSEPSEPRELGPRVKICSWSCSSWFHPLRSWSLQQTRDGSRPSLRCARSVNEQRMCCAGARDRPGMAGPRILLEIQWSLRMDRLRCGHLPRSGAEAPQS
jgi:hypothetical protein